MLDQMSMLARAWVRPCGAAPFVVAALLAICAFVPVAPSLAGAVTMDTVAVGDPGNANSIYSHGGVNHVYAIGKYEVTVGQYAAFLNAVAATDTYGLYNTSMAFDLNIAGIERSGVSGSYSYSVLGSPNKPVTYVSWGDAARFCNWLSNGQPTGVQSASTTKDGTYTLNGAVIPSDWAVSRNLGAQWFLPTEDEWYKAAYYQPASRGGDSDNYWAYPTRTNVVPNSDSPPGDVAIQENVANFFRNDSIPNGYNGGYAVTGVTTLDPLENYLTDVGAYASASGPYGTFDQGGNVYEWNESFVLGKQHGWRGGSWANPSGAMRDDDRPTITLVESSRIGFRVATVPEPGSAVLAATGLLTALAWRRVRRSSARSANRTGHKLTGS